MLFLCISLIIGGFRYRKREALLTSHFQYPGTAYGCEILLQCSEKHDFGWETTPIFILFNLAKNDFLMF